MREEVHRRFNSTPEHQRFFTEEPEFLITRRDSFHTEHTIEQHIEPRSLPAVVKPGEMTPQAPSAEQVVEYARNVTKSVTEAKGGIVEVWIRVGCFKAEPKDWT